MARLTQRIAIAAAGALLLAAAAPPSIPEVGAPELARLGPDGAGVTARTVVDKGQIEPIASLAQGRAVTADRVLPLRIWYPAKIVRGARTAIYRATLVSEPPNPPIGFTTPALAVQDAPAAGQGYPIVLLSHGYNNDPVMMSWLAENLATKGYVVVGIEHHDPSIVDAAKAPATLLRRPLDIVFVLRQLRAGLLGKLADASRIALVGYSFGGYGVMTVAGARLDPASPAVQALPKPLVEDYAGDGRNASLLHDGAIKAVVALAPAGGAPWTVWGAGVSNVRAPLLMLAGSVDRTVGYEQGPAAIFAAATGADRAMITFVNAGHSIGVNPAPPEMRGRLWDFDWFEDPVWRKERINAISTHFITAFLDLHLKGDASRAAYFTVPSEQSDNAAWKGAEAPYAAVSLGGDNPTWKGFVRNHQNGLILRHLPASR